ncbi:MAG: NADH-quinone oxidoreductase subunit NuoN [Dichotomicrobium sp.]
MIAFLTAYQAIVPEAFLLLSAVTMLMISVFTTGTTRFVTWASVAALLVAAVLVIAQPPETATLFDRAFIADGFARFMKVLVLLASALALTMSQDYLRGAQLNITEYPVLVLLATAGMMMMLSANDLISLYLALELQSLSLYVIAAFRRESLRSSEAGLKYFVLGALSSGFLLYGASLLYGFTGSTSFEAIALSAQTAGPSLGLIFGLVFLLTGLAFKVSAVPFHMWTPDVYEGAPTPATALFSAASKAAAVGLLVRVLMSAVPALAAEWQQIVIAIAVASMGLGAFGAIGQKNIKRLMAYSSIGHVGYMLVGLSASSQQGTQAVLVYLAIYVAMTLGTFACILSMRRSEGMVEGIDELSGLSRNQPMLAFLLAMLMFSMAGIPPLAGFFAKFYVFAAAVNAGLSWLAVIGVVASVIAAFYYLRVVKVMYFDEPADAFQPLERGPGFVLAVTSAFTILFFLAPGPLVAAADAAAKALLN